MRPLPLASTALAGLFALSACAVVPPPGPTILAQPGQGKSAQQFQAEDARCRQAAVQANGGVTPSQAATQSGIGSAALGTVLGAAAGALLGAAAGDPAAGAAIGAGGGLLFGSASGADSAQRSGAAFQGNYDNAYAQCTISSGNMIVQPQVVAYQGPGGYGSYAPALTPPPPPPLPPQGEGYGW